MQKEKPKEDVMIKEVRDALGGEGGTFKPIRQEGEGILYENMGGSGENNLVPYTEIYCPA